MIPGQLALDGAGMEPPKRKRRKRKLPKIVSAAEAKRLLDAASADVLVTEGERVRNRLILEVMYRAGLRVSETTTLTPRDIEHDGLIRLYDAKGGDGTAYFDPDRIIPLLDAWLAVRESWIGSPLSAPLFVRPDGRPMTVRYIQRLVKRLKAEIGVTGILTPHVLRHTFATELIEEGAPIHEVQEAMRHANLATTAVYLHVRNESLRRRIVRRGKE